jgi:RNA polymerase sigma-70 factor (ECF subfamily)
MEGAGTAFAVGFLAALSDRARIGAPDFEQWRVSFAARFERAVAIHPEVRVDPVAFASYCAERASRGDGAEAPNELHLSDLLLAHGCAQGDVNALGKFERLFFGEVDRACARSRTVGAQLDDIKQILRARIFVGTDGATPKIADYTGRGSLQGWFRVVVARAVVNAATRGPREMAVDHDLLADYSALATDPELACMRERYREAFRDAFADACSALGSRAVALLRYSLVEHLSLEQIAGVYHVHRATAVRWLAQARDDLQGELRRALSARLSIDPAEVEGVVRLVRSRVELTLERLLHS